MPDDDVIRLRLKNMDCLVEPQFTSNIQKKIEEYVIRNKDIGEMILGRSVIYFPYFEQILKENGLPTELKYLAIVESALNPVATSRVGAGGLWQFMPGTATTYGLRIDRTIDERADIIRSTEAAAKHLKKLYEIYGDWKMALAAYNSGTGKVANAMRLAQSRSFERVAPYLPVETRNFIPNFIAVSYLFSYYVEHGLKPVLPEMDLQLTSKTKVYNQLTLEKIAAVTDLPVSTVKALNAGFISGYIPPSANGYTLVLPRRVIEKFNAYMNAPDAKPMPITIALPDAVGDEENYTKTVYTVMAGDNLEKIAEWLHCSPYNIMMWNNLYSDKLLKDKELVVYIAGLNTRRTAMQKVVETFAALPKISVFAVASVNATQAGDLLYFYAAPQKVEYTYHLVKPGESLWDIVQAYEDVTIKEVLLLNGMDRKVNIVAGNLLKIKRLLENEFPLESTILAKK